MQFGQSACMFRISYGFQCRQDRRYIADIGNLALIIGMDDITGFDSLKLCHLQRWKPSNHSDIFEAQ